MDHNFRYHKCAYLQVRTMDSSGVKDRGLSRTKNLTPTERNGILQELLRRTTNSRKLKWGAIKEVADIFGVTRLSVSRVWSRATEDYSEGKSCADVSGRKKGRCGRKRNDYSDNYKVMRGVPFNERGTLRSLSCRIGVPKTTLGRKLKVDKEIKRVSSAIRPYLTEENKLVRLRYCLERVRPDGRFYDFYDYVHIDEKWFYMTQTNRRYYVLPDEQVPHRTCKSKRFITKVMFLAAVARPRWDATRKQWFDGKLGIWPFVVKEAAKKNSKNRLKGTLVTKPTESVNANESRKMILKHLFPGDSSEISAQLQTNTGTCSTR